MADLLSTGVSGLLASQANLATTSNNISNAATPGYSRQSVTLNENVPQSGDGTYTIGTGVNVTAVKRAYSQYQTQALWSSNSGLQSATTFNNLASSLNDILSGSGNLQSSLDSFYGGISNVANAPGDSATRQSLLGNAKSLTTVFNTLGQQLDQQQSRVDSQIANTVTGINSLSGQIADLNKQIAQSNNSQNAPNALLDKRDQLVQQLAGLTDISTTTQDNGTINIAMGSSQTLVNGAQSYALHTGGTAYDAGRTDVYDNNGNDITGSIGGGTLGGLINYRGVLDSTRNTLGQSAVALAASVNTQQAKGLDLNGNQGAAIFSVDGPSVHGSTNNTGNASVAASITDTSGLTGSDYTLTYAGPGNGTNGWTLKNGNGQNVTLTDNGDGTLSADGLTFAPNGSPQQGDSYQIQPTRNAASSLAVSLTDPNGIAAAAALATSAGTGNTGTAQVASSTVTNTNDPNLLSDAVISFGAGNAYTVKNPAGTTVYGSGTWTAGQPIKANGWSLSLTGTPGNGDTFTVGANSNGLNDNSNALSMAQLSSTGVLDGGKTSVVDSYANLTARIGATGQQAQSNLGIQTSINNQATSAQQSVAGVNLDEEAANLVKFQQAYQASAKIISSAQTLFTSLLNAIPG